MSEKIITRVDELEKYKCTGCSACSQLCPNDSISMQEDSEGFLYPVIDEINCDNCGLCWEQCPANKSANVFYPDYEQKLYASMLKDDNIRFISSSGGAFSAFAEVVFSQKGYVVGVAYDNCCKAIEHIIIDSNKYLDKIRRSKLVQSSKNNVFVQIKKLLNEQNTVFFTGTPCEIAGLKNFLNNEYSNLITCDIICGCVASQKVYRSYLKYMENIYKSSIKSINFKDKTKGWQQRGISIYFENGKVYTNSTSDDPYIVSFHSRLNIRPSCFHCKYRGVKRITDITIGDFWGIKYKNPEYDDNKGTSFVLINSKKGESLLKQTLKFMKSNICDLDLRKYGELYNVCLVKSPEAPDEITRKCFYADLNLLNFGEIFDKYLIKIRDERKLRKQKYFDKIEESDKMF